MYVVYTMPKSLCKGKRTSTPNKCKKLVGCKVARGTQRTFCRKKYNKNRKTRKNTTKKRGKNRSEVSRLKGLSKKQERALNHLK